MKTGDPHHHRRAEDNATDYFSDDTGLTEEGERIVEKAAEDDYNAGLGGGLRVLVLMWEQIAKGVCIMSLASKEIRGQRDGRRV